MAESFRRRPGTPMIASPAQDNLGDPRRREPALRRQFDDEIAARFTGGGPRRRFVGDPTAPDAMPRRMDVDDRGEPLPTPEPGMMQGTLGVQGDDLEGKIRDYLASQGTEVPPERIAQIAATIRDLVRQGWPEAQVAPDVIDAMASGLSSQRAKDRFLRQRDSF